MLHLNQLNQLNQLQLKTMKNQLILSAIFRKEIMRKLVTAGFIFETQAERRKMAMK